MRHHVDYCAHLVEDKSPNLATEKNIKQNRLQTVFSTFVQHTATPPPFDDWARSEEMFGFTSEARLPFFRSTFGVLKLS